MKVAKAKGRLRGKQPKLKPAQEAHLIELWRAGKHTRRPGLAELFSVARSTIYRAVEPAGEPARATSSETVERPGPRLVLISQGGPLTRAHRRDHHPAGRRSP